MYLQQWNNYVLLWNMEAEYILRLPLNKFLSKWTNNEKQKYFYGFVPITYFYLKWSRPFEEYDKIVIY